MYNAIIVDDEPKLIEVLKLKLNQHFPLLKIIATARDAVDAYDKITTLKPDIVFLDISMPIESGLDLLNKFVSIDFQIIFVTGYNEFALDALKLSAVDYILKPIDNEDLIRAVNKGLERVNQKEKISNYNILKDNINLIGDQNSTIIIPELHGYEFVIISNIVRCQSWERFTKIYLSSGDILTSAKPLSVFTSMLIPYSFFSPHRSHVFNNMYLKSYNTKKDLIILKDGSEIPLSRRRKVAFVSSNIYKSIAN